MKKLLLIFFSILLLVTVLNLIFQFITPHKYGDYGSLEVYIKQARPFTRWFLGSTLITDIYWKLWQPIITHLPIQINYVKFLSALTINLFSLLLIKRVGSKLYIIFPLLSTLWVMFSTGYDEYYPFIAPIYLLTLIWLFIIKETSHLKHFLIISLIISLLPLVYIGFLPLALIILIYFIFTKFNKAPFILITSFAIFFITVVRFWPWGIESFFTELLKQLNLGETGTEYFRYLGQSAGIYSVNFKTSYVLSLEHLRDLLFMISYGGGIPILLLFFSAVFLRLKRKSYQVRQLITPKRLLSLAILGQQTYYLFFMIPKMGPVKDIDLFFSVFITFAFFAGLMWESILSKQGTRSHLIKNIIIAAYFGITIISLSQLLIRGLPSI